MKKTKNYLYIVLGFLFMGIGGVGAVLPILPTVPFLLLASYFFMKGSEKMDRWFKSTKLYKNHLESFEKNKSMKISTKIAILSFASFMLGLAFIKIDVLPMRLCIAVLILIKYYYFIFKIDTIEEIKN